MPPQSLELKGKTFGNLKVIRRAGSTQSGRSQWRCKCVCGSVVIVVGSEMTRGNKTSCGCKNYECKVTHGLSRRGSYTERIYNIHIGMMGRCHNPKQSDYPNYGARGIKVCKKWHDVRAFAEWSLANGYSPGLTIDRINTDGDYKPSNCRWATLSEQSKNRRYHGKKPNPKYVKG